MFLQLFLFLSIWSVFLWFCFLLTPWEQCFVKERLHNLLLSAPFFGWGRWKDSALYLTHIWFTLSKEGGLLATHTEAPEFTRAATLLCNLRGSCSVTNKSGWNSPSGNNIFQPSSPDVMPGGLYKYPEPIRAIWTVFHPPTPFPFECLPSARSEKQALLCFVCPSVLTSHFLPVNCQRSKAEHWEPHVKKISLRLTVEVNDPEGFFLMSYWSWRSWKSGSLPEADSLLMCGLFHFN